MQDEGGVRMGAMDGGVRGWGARAAGAGRIGTASSLVMADRISTCLGCLVVL